MALSFILDSPMFLSGGGEMGGRIRAYDWAATPLGPPQGWPTALKAMVRLLLSSKHAMFIWWGEELIQLYNDAYRATLPPERHPALLGRPGKDCWAEAWPTLGPDIDHVMSGAGSIWREDQRAMVARDDRAEESWWTYSLSPIEDESRPSGVGGVLVITTDVTAQHRAAEAGYTRAAEVIEAMNDGFALLDHDLRVLHVNNASVLMDGRSAEDFYGRTPGELWPVLVGTPVEAAYVKVAETREPVFLQHHYVSGQADLWLDFRFYPVADGVAVFYRNFTAAKRAEDALQQSEERFRLAQEVGGIGSYEWVPATDDLFVSNEARRIWGVAADAPVSIAMVVEMIHPADRPGAMAVARDDLEGRAGAAEYRIVRADDGEIRWLSRHAEVVSDPATGAVRVIGAFQDITERKLAEQHRELLINELNHRVKNTLATVQSIAHQTLADAFTMAEARERLDARLIAMARAHDTLTRENWGAPTLADIVTGALQPFGAGDGAGFAIEGPAVRVTPKVALALAMALHELATNAVKHGALSAEAGRVSVAWSPAADGQVDFSWRESGGPAVSAPARKGFGSRLLTRGVAAEFGRAPGIDYEPTGLVYRAAIPTAEA
jgi:PAS domain S-box-containing protein